jgi:ABC-type sugar transport system substrate-binding protein
MKMKKTAMKVATAVAVVLAAGTARAQDAGTALKTDYQGALSGKTIAFVPMALGVPLMDTWNHVIATEAERSGMRYEVRDPAWNTSAQVQAMEAIIAEKPDVLVVHNPNVQLMVEQIKRAMADGIYVIQISMMSNTLSDGYVGGDWIDQGAATGKRIVEECGQTSGKSGKVVILQGEITSAQNIYMVNGINSEFAKDPTIQVVSDQATNWDATKAYEITSAVLQQHPDVCAIFGPYDIMTLGASEAVAQAGLAEEILIFSNGGGYEVGCEAVRDGKIDRYMNWEAQNQGREVMTLARALLQSGAEPGTLHLASYSSYSWVTPDNVDSALCSKLPS